MLTDTSTRLNKYISSKRHLFASRAGPFYRTGQCLYQRQTRRRGDQVVAGDVVEINGRLIEPREADDLVLIALDKPVGIVSTTKTTNATILSIL